MSPRKKTNSERTNVFFPPDVIKELKRLSEERGTSVSGIIRMIVLEYLSNRKK